MSKQELDLRRFQQAVGRYGLVVAAIAVLGLAAGAAFAVLRPPMFASKALLILPTSAAKYIGTEVVIASSPPVLTGALPNIHPPVTLNALMTHVQAKGVTSNVV